MFTLRLASWSPRTIAFLAVLLSSRITNASSISKWITSPSDGRPLFDHPNSRCLLQGAALVKVCSAFRAAETEVTERLLLVKNLWLRSEVQLRVVRDIAHTLDTQHQNIQLETLELLVSKLKIAVSSLESAAKNKDLSEEKRSVQRWKYAFLHQKIDKVLRDLKTWQRMFDPSWYLIIKAATPQIDSELRTLKGTTSNSKSSLIAHAQSLRKALNPDPASKVPVFLPENGLGSLHLQSIPRCAAKIAQRGNPDKALIFEEFQLVEGLDARQVEKDLRDLARKLIHSSPQEFGLLNCKGVVRHFSEEHPDPSKLSSLTIVFRAPSNYSQPCSLWGHLENMPPPDSLSDRFHLASKLARAVSYVHTFGFVHKNIRPETILLLTTEGSLLPSLFLVGFDDFRAADGRAARRGSVAWDLCLYQHPNRVGSVARQDYAMQHDIYSLGVYLLELGLWESLIVYNDEGVATPSCIIENRNTDPGGFKDNLLMLSRGELRSKMGSMYSEVVETCLTSLDPGNVDFGDESEFQDEDGIQVGVRYIEKVTMRLDSIFV